jgi:hypothetical protein
MTDGSWLPEEGVFIMIACCAMVARQMTPAGEPAYELSTTLNLLLIGAPHEALNGAA